MMPIAGLPEDEFRALVHLRALPGTGDRDLRLLIARYGSARAALNAPARDLGALAALARDRKPIAERVDRTLAYCLTVRPHVWWDGADYPRALRALDDPPMLVFGQGDASLLQRRCVAVVGSRQITEYGAEAARLLAHGLARAGIVVVSGLARGIDGIAHEAALEAGGTTIAVLGCGIDVPYPRVHTALYERIAAEGLLISEFLPGTPPMPFHFPRRNRLIAALGELVVVVEARERSGALSTVSHALALGRDVLAVPGPIGRPTSAGTNALLRDGAGVVTAVDDILFALKALPRSPAGDRGAGAGAAVTNVRSVSDRSASERPARSPVAGAGPDDPLARVWHALGSEARHIDDVVVAAGVATPMALAMLLQLELGGHARQLPGSRYALPIS